MANFEYFFAVQFALGCIIGLPAAAVVGLKMAGFDATAQRPVAAALAVMLVVIAYGCYHNVPDLWHATLLLVKMTLVLELAFGSLLGLYSGFLTKYSRRKRK